MSIVEIVDDDYRAQLDQAQANVVAAGAAIDNIEQQKRLQETLVKQAEAEIQASEADVTRYHLEAVRQETLAFQKLRRHASARRSRRSTTKSARSPLLP